MFPTESESASRPIDMTSLQVTRSPTQAEVIRLPLSPRAPAVAHSTRTPTSMRTSPSPLTSLLMDSSSSSTSSGALDCVVCGDRATGNHYGARCCEGCKGFFKRWLQNQNVFICRQGTDECIIDAENRNRCQACRLKKCMAIGMNSTQRSMDFTAPTTSAQPTPLQQILLEPKIEDVQFDLPQIDLKPYEDEVERAKHELSSSQMGMQKFERLWKKETDEYLAKKAEFELVEARYMERRDVYLEALENRKRKLANAKEDFEIKVQRLNEAKMGDFNADYY